MDTFGLKGKTINFIKVFLIVGFPDILIALVGIYFYLMWVRED